MRCRASRPWLLPLAEQAVRQQRLEDVESARCRRGLRRSGARRLPAEPGDACAHLRDLLQVLQRDAARERRGGELLHILIVGELLRLLRGASSGLLVGKGLLIEAGENAAGLVASAIERLRGAELVLDILIVLVGEQ